MAGDNMATKNTVKAAPITAALKKEIAAVLMRFGLLLEERMRMNIRDGGGIYMGTLSGSIAAIPPREVPQGILLKVGTPVEHGAYYEFGTRPHTPPLEPIRRWVEVKLQPHVLAVAIEYKEVGGKTRALPRASGHKVLKGAAREIAILQLAKRIQAKIRASGTEPHFFIARALQALGAPYQLVPSDGEMTYRVDLGAYLAKNEPELWNHVAAYLTTGQAA